jgi:hypothetical protein
VRIGSAFGVGEGRCGFGVVEGRVKRDRSQAVGVESLDGHRREPLRGYMRSGDTVGGHDGQSGLAIRGNGGRRSKGDGVEATAVVRGQISM